MDSKIKYKNAHKQRNINHDINHHKTMVVMDHKMKYKNAHKRRDINHNINNHKTIVIKLGGKLSEHV